MLTKSDIFRFSKITPAEAESAGLKTLYEQAFPPEERRHWNDFSAMPDEFSMLAIVSAETPVGIVTLWRFPVMAYVEHFAIAPQMRGHGIGASVLRRIAEMCAPLPLVLEVEPETTGEMARRRIGFYRRCGFTDFPGFDYTQPPYSAGLPPVALTLMSTDPGIDLTLAAATLHHRVYGV